MVKKTKNELHDWAGVTKKQLPRILNTKEKKNEAERKLGSSWFSLAEVGGGDCWVEGVALQTGPHAEKDLILPRAPKRAKATAQS